MFFNIRPDAFVKFRQEFRKRELLGKQFAHDRLNSSDHFHTFRLRHTVEPCILLGGIHITADRGSDIVAVILHPACFPQRRRITGRIRVVAAVALCNHFVIRRPYRQLIKPAHPLDQKIIHQHTLIIFDRMRIRRQRYYPCKFRRLSLSYEFVAVRIDQWDRT